MKGSGKSLEVFRWSDPGAERELQEMICSCIFLSDLPERNLAARLKATSGKRDSISTLTVHNELSEKNITRMEEARLCRSSTASLPLDLFDGDAFLNMYFLRGGHSLG